MQFCSLCHHVVHFLFSRCELVEVDMMEATPGVLDSHAQGVYEGVMPGNTVLHPEGASGATSSSATPSASHRGTPSGGGGVTSSAQQLQPRFKVWQPSFGPGSPQTPIVIARALGAKNSKMSTSTKPAATATTTQGHRESRGAHGSSGGYSEERESGESEDFSANSSAALRAGAKGGTGLPAARERQRDRERRNAEAVAVADPRGARAGRVSLATFGKTKSAVDVVRGSKPWAGGLLPGSGAGRRGEWEGGDSSDDSDDDEDDETSDEEDGDDLILRR